MTSKSEQNSLWITTKLINEYIKEGDAVLDATVGNGQDILLMAKKAGKSGQVYGIDIQSIAIENTKSLLEKEDLIDNIFLIKANHENINKYIFEKLDFVIYNLGYLPKGDKSIKTQAIYTVNSIIQALELLKINGIIVITVYTGHPGGLEEKLSIEDLIVNLDQRQFNVLKYEFINQKNNPPIVYRIEKIKI